MTKCIASPLSRQNIRDMAYFIRKIAGQENVLCIEFLIYYI